MAGNLGYATTFVLDATCTSTARTSRPPIPADELARVTGANLQGESAEVVNTHQLLAH